jgi:hypothetical protein
MWDERECGEKRAGAADILSSWALVAAILLAIAIWPGLQLLLTDAMGPDPGGARYIGATEYPGDTECQDNSVRFRLECGPVHRR